MTLPETLFKTTREQAEEELYHLQLIGYEAEIIQSGNVFAILTTGDKKCYPQSVSH